MVAGVRHGWRPGWQAQERGLGGGGWGRAACTRGTRRTGRGPETQESAFFLVGAYRTRLPLQTLKYGLHKDIAMHLYSFAPGRHCRATSYPRAMAQAGVYLPISVV